MEISIIIPVYNAEKYLERCLKSVLEALEGTQGEVLVVDNGSTDNSLKVALKCQKMRPGAIHILKCPVSGAGAARNYGVKRAQGEYIWFIDADDYINTNAVKKLLKTATKAKADLVMLGAKKLNLDGSVTDYRPVSPDETEFKHRFVRYGMGPWQVIIRRKWWVQREFLFSEGIIHEDMELMSALILYTDKFASVDEPLYYYCANFGSVLHKEAFDPHIFDIFPALSGLYQRFVEAQAVNEYHDDLEWFFIWNLLIDSAKDFAKFKEGKVGFFRSRQMLSQYFPAWRKNKYLRQKPLKTRMRIKLNYLK